MSLDTISITVVYTNGHTIQLTFAIEPDVCLGAAGQWFPGVAYHGPQYDAVPEVVAYAINEGRITADRICGDTDDEPPMATWSVNEASLPVLRRHGVI